MATSTQHGIWVFGNALGPAAIGVALAIGLMASVVATQAQTYTVIHTFTGEADGAGPRAGLTIDPAGNLYGTTERGGTAGNGIVFKLISRNSSWLLTPLYSFLGGSDGSSPDARVILGADGRLYGTTNTGGGNGCPGGQGCGTVFSLRPPARVCQAVRCPWTETVLYRFPGSSAGGLPYSDVIFDQSGDLYGTTAIGGASNCLPPFGCGVVYELTPAGQGWSENVLYSFTGGNDGETPVAGVTLGADGNLYGTNRGQAIGSGSVFQLVRSGSSWTENTLHTFQGGSDGGNPDAGLIFDGPSRLYGATTAGGANGGGTAFDLTLSNGNWVFAVDYSFVGDNGGPHADLVMDQAGNLYGTTLSDGRFGNGAVFKLTRSGGGWTYTSLHDFTGGSDGGGPYSSLVFDANGNLYGTTVGGGSCCGVVFEITP